MTPIRNWKRFVAVSCSHGEIICPSARYELLTFCDQYRPHTTLHLGDFIDTTAFLAGATTTEDAPVEPDIDAGLQFLRDYHGYGSHQRHTWCGNHEDRLWRLATNRREMVAFAARCVIGHVETTCKLLGSPLYQYSYDSMWRLMGDTYFGHGYLFNMQAARDHAEALGRSVVFGHTHTIQTATSRSLRNATGYNIGWLGDKTKATYAKTRRQTRAWATGFAYGEYCGDKTVVNIHRCREVSSARDNDIKIG